MVIWIDLNLFLLGAILVVLRDKNCGVICFGIVAFGGSFSIIRWRYSPGAWYRVKSRDWIKFNVYLSNLIVSTQDYFKVQVSK